MNQKMFYKLGWGWNGRVFGWCWTAPRRPIIPKCTQLQDQRKSPECTMETSWFNGWGSLPVWSKVLGEHLNPISWNCVSRSQPIPLHTTEPRGLMGCQLYSDIYLQGFFWRNGTWNQKMVSLPLPSTVSSPHMVTSATSIFHASPEEDNSSISLHTQQLDISCSKASVAALSANRFPPSDKGENVKHLAGTTQRRWWPESKIQAVTTF